MDRLGKNKITVAKRITHNSSHLKQVVVNARNGPEKYSEEESFEEELVQP